MKELLKDAFVKLHKSYNVIKLKIVKHFSHLGIHRFSSWFVLIFILLATLFFLNAYYYSDPIIKVWLPTNVKKFKEFQSSEFVADENNDRKEPQCHLPQLDPYDKSIIEHLEPPPPGIDCTVKSPKLFRTDFKNKLIRMAPFRGNCCYKVLARKGISDGVSRFSKRCIPITKKVTTIPSSHEFIMVRCQIIKYNNTQDGDQEMILSNFTDMFAFVPVKKIIPRPANNDLLTEQSKTKVNNDKQLNIIILGLDGQSHMNFIRQMSSTYNYIMNNLSAIEMHGYTKVGDNTFPNVIPMMTSLNVSELMAKCWRSKYTYFDNCPFIWKEFAKREYFTSFAEDSVWMGIFSYEKLGFYRQPTDYYLNPFALQMSNKLGHHILGNTKLCYGPRLAFEVLLDYLVKTCVRFSSTKNRFFQFIWANSLFHDYLNHPTLGDEVLFMTIHWLITHGHLNNTLLILASDHGIRWGSIRSTYQGRVEERLPMLYFIFPQWFIRHYSIALHNLKLNAHRLTTPFDIHETLVDLLDVEQNLKNQHLLLSQRRRQFHPIPRGRSLFRQVPPSRTCEQAQIDAHWCVCHKLKPISTKSNIVQHGAKFILFEINQLISNYSVSGNYNQNPCAKLKLSKINSAMRKVDDDEDDSIDGNNNVDRDIPSSSETYDTQPNNSSNTSATGQFASSDFLNIEIELQLTLVVKPNDAILEATIYKTKDNDWKISGEISRLNLYKEQSICIDDPIVQKYCYCDDTQTKT